MWVGADYNLIFLQGNEEILDEVRRKEEFSVLHSGDSAYSKTAAARRQKATTGGLSHKTAPRRRIKNQGKTAAA